MILDGRTVIEKGMVSFPKDEYEVAFDTEEQAQPNGVDLRCIAVSQISGNLRVPREGSVSFNEIRHEEIPWKNGWISLKPGVHYVVNFRENIAVREGFCAIIVARSSLLRGGAHITSAVWDTGFEGKLGGVIRPLNPMDIELGARLAQVQFHQAVFNGHRYEGRYQGTSSQTALMT